MKNLFQLRMMIVLKNINNMTNNIMCKDYKEYEIDLNDKRIK